MKTRYAETLEDARNDLASKGAELFKLQAEVRRLEQTVAALTTLVEQPSLDPGMGITDGIRVALRLVAPAGLYPTTVRIKLEEAGFSFAKQKNPMATIHSILKRLKKQGFVKSGEVRGKTSYVWLTDKPQMLKKG